MPIQPMQIRHQRVTFGVAPMEGEAPPRRLCQVFGIMRTIG